MDLLDMIKERRENADMTRDAKKGKYSAKFVKAQRGTIKDYETLFLRFKAQGIDEDNKDCQGGLTYTMFINADEEKLLNQLAFMVGPMNEAGLVSDSMTNKIPDNLDGFIDYLNDNGDLYDWTLRVSPNTYNGNTRNQVAIVSLKKSTTDSKDPFADNKTTDADKFDGEDSPF